MIPYRNHAGVRPPPNLKAVTIRLGSAAVCSLAGDLHLDNEKHIADALARALYRAPTLLAVEMSAVTLFTSSGLNALLDARRRAAAAGVPLVLAAPSRAVQRVLEATGAHHVFPLYPSLEQAVRHQPSAPTA